MRRRAATLPLLLLLARLLAVECAVVIRSPAGARIEISGTLVGGASVDGFTSVRIAGPASGCAGGACEVDAGSVSVRDGATFGAGFAVRYGDALEIVRGVSIGGPLSVTAGGAAAEPELDARVAGTVTFERGGERVELEAFEAGRDLSACAPVAVGRTTLVEPPRAPAGGSVAALAPRAVAGRGPVAMRTWGWNGTGLEYAFGVEVGDGGPPLRLTPFSSSPEAAVRLDLPRERYVPVAWARERAAGLVSAPARAEGGLEVVAPGGRPAALDGLRSFDAVLPALAAYAVAAAAAAPSAGTLGALAPVVADASGAGPLEALGAAEAVARMAAAAGGAAAASGDAVLASAATVLGRAIGYGEPAVLGPAMRACALALDAFAPPPDAAAAAGAYADAADALAEALRAGRAPSVAAGRVAAVSDGPLPARARAPAGARALLLPSAPRGCAGAGAACPASSYASLDAAGAATVAACLVPADGANGSRRLECGRYDAAARAWTVAGVWAAGAGEGCVWCEAPPPAELALLAYAADGAPAADAAGGASAGGLALGAAAIAGIAAAGGVALAVVATAAGVACARRRAAARGDRDPDAWVPCIAL